MLMAAQMLVDNGLEDWHLNIKNVTSYNAITYYRPKLIILSLNFVTIATEKQFEGIMFHEIAHALAGGANGHNQVFKNKYFELSGNKDFDSASTILFTKNFITHCNNCNTKSSLNHNRPRWCRKCYRNGKVVSSLIITPNPLKLVLW